MYHLGLNIPQYFILCTWTNCESLFVHHCLLHKGTPLMPVEKCTHGYNDKSLGAGLILCQFCRIRVDFPLRALNMFSRRFLAQTKCQGWVSSCGVSFQSNEKMIGYSHGTPATRERESMSCRAGHYRSFQGSHLGETNDYPSGDVHDTSGAGKTTQEV